MINFNKFYKSFSIVSTLLVAISIILLSFKGLNFGIDFKGGTLIELRTQDNQTNVATLRRVFSKMNLGDVNIKKFGQYDHQRVYGLDYFDKLKSIGFEVEPLKYSKDFKKEEIKKYGLIENEIIPVCKKLIH